MQERTINPDSIVPKRRFSWRIFLCSLLVLNNFVIIVNNLKAKADNVVTITSPSQGQSLTSANPTITGTATAGKWVNIKIDNTYVGVVQADNNGNWSYQAQDLSNTTHSVQASITDGTGIAGSVSGRYGLAKFSINKPTTDSVTTNDAKISSPTKAVFNSDSTRVYVMDTSSNKVNVIDTNTKAILATVTLSGQPKDIAYSQTKNKVYVTTGTTQNVDVIDATNLPNSSTPIDMNRDTGVIRLDTDGETFYISCGTYLEAICIGDLDDVANLSNEQNLSGTIYQIVQIADNKVVVVNSQLDLFTNGALAGSSAYDVTGVNVVDPAAQSIAPFGSNPDYIAVPNNTTGSLDLRSATDLSYASSISSIGNGPYTIMQHNDQLFVYCAGSQHVAQLSISLQSLQNYSATIGYGSTVTGIGQYGGNLKLYFAVQANYPNVETAKIQVYNPTSLQVENTVQLDNINFAHAYMQPDNGQLWVTSQTASQIRVLSPGDDSIVSTIYDSPSAGPIFVGNFYGTEYYTNSANSYDYGRIRKILDNGSEAGSVELGTPGQADFKLSRNNNKIIAYSAITKEFSVIDPTNMSIERTFAQAFDCTDDWDINGDASKIYCGDGIGIVNVYNSSDGSLATAHLIAFNQVSNPNLRVSADGNFIYVADAYNLYKYDVAQDATNSVGVSAQTRLNIADSRTARDQMSLNPAETRLYLGGGDKIEIFDVTSNTPVSLGHMDSAAANPRHDLVFSADGKRAFMAYAAPVNSQPGIVVAEFDTQNNLPMGVLNVDKNPLTGAGLVLSNNVTVVESATVSFDVNQPVIYDTNGSFEFIKNNPTTQDVATRYALGALSINVTGGNVPDGMTFGICNYGPEQRPCFQGTPVTPGSYTFTASISDGITNSEKEFNVTINNGIEFLNPNNESPNIQTTTGVTGQSYSATFSVRHRVGNSTISLINGTLPPGLNFTQVDNDTATITGTIDQNQPIEGVCFTLQATDDYNSNEQGFCMNIVATPLSITTGSLPDGTFTTPYNQTVYTAGGDAPTSFSVISGSLPSGLELDSGTGVISGTPSSPGTYTFTIRATDRTGSVEQEYVLVIQSGVNNNAEITTTSLSRGRINIRYTGDYVQRIQAANFTGDVSWSVVTGDLPAGLSLYQDGNDAIIDGTPTESGIFTFTVAASDGINDRTKELSIRIDPNPPEPARTSVTITSPTNGVSLGGPTQLVTGTASPAGSIIQLSIDNDNPFDVQVGGDGKWSFEAKGLTSGPHTFRASIKQSAREYAYVPNTYTHDVNIINTVTDTVVGTIKTPNPNLFTGGAWATKDGKTVYVGGGDVQTDPVFSISTLIYELDTATNTFKRSIRLENDQLNSFVIDASDRYAYTSTIDTTNGTKKLVKIDLKNMQIVKTTTVPSLGNYSPYLPFGYSALSDDESKLFIPYSASNFVSIVDTNTLTVIGSTDIGRPSIQLQALPDDKIVAMPFLEVPTANPVITILNQSGQVASTVTTDTQGTQVLYLGSLLSSDNQYIINRFSIPSENLNGISIANPTTLSNVGVLTGIGFGFGMSATADSQKVYVVNGNRDPVGGGFGWGSVDVIKNPTGMLVGSKYPIQVGLFTQALGNWIANIPETTISTSTSVNIYGGVKPSSGGTTVITLPGFRLPNISLPNIKPFNLPSYNFNPNLNLPNLAPITGLPTDKVSVSKTNAGVLDNLLGTLKTSVSLVPTKVALAFPYLMLLVLIVMILSLLAQTRDELEKAREIKRIIAKRKSLEEERNNFISLISHYLNTPISMMQGGVDLIATLQRAPKSMTDSLQKTLSSLGQKIKSMLTSTAQSSLDKPVDTKNPIMIKPYKSFAVMAPVILVAVFTAATNWLFNAAGVVDISIINIFTQIMAFALLIQALFSTYKHHENAKHNLALAQASLDNEVTMAQARLHFLSGSVEELKTEVAGLRRNLPGLAAAPNAKAVKDGYARLQSILSRLQLLTEIEQDKHRGEIKSFNLRRAVENVISQYKPQLAARNITVDIDVTKSLYIKQDQQMLELVISSLIDNAIKFVPKSDGYIKIASRVNKGRISLTVSDNGAGIAKTKLKQLFKPFSRAESALRFNYEGLGLSLYLDKVIVEKLGGTIQIESSKGSGTTVTIDLSPQHKPVSTPKKR